MQVFPVNASEVEGLRGTLPEMLQSLVNVDTTGLEDPVALLCQIVQSNPVMHSYLRHGN